MKVLIDTCGWIEWLTNGSLLNNFSPYFAQTDDIIIPVVVQYELYKWVCREVDEITALEIIGVTELGRVIPLTTSLVLFAADLAKQYKLAMADAFIYATAQQEYAEVITCDNHFLNLPDIIYFPK